MMVVDVFALVCLIAIGFTATLYVSVLAFATLVDWIRKRVKW